MTTRSPSLPLIETCAGNYTNQEVAFKGQIVDSTNIILRSSTTESLEVCLNKCTVVHINVLLITLFYFYHHVLILAWGTDKGSCINNWIVGSYVGRDTWKQQGFSWGYFTRSWCWCCFFDNEMFICKYKIIYFIFYILMVCCYFRIQHRIVSKMRMRQNEECTGKYGHING